jgi:copper chaperone CopZ
MKTYTFHVSGTHCASCKILIEDILGEQTNISNAHVDLKNETVTLDTNEIDQHNLVKVLNEKIKDNGYQLTFDKIPQ